MIIKHIKRGSEFAKTKWNEHKKVIKLHTKLHILVVVLVSILKYVHIVVHKMCVFVKGLYVLLRVAQVVKTWSVFNGFFSLMPKNSWRKFLECYIHKKPSHKNVNNSMKMHHVIKFKPKTLGFSSYIVLRRFYGVESKEKNVMVWFCKSTIYESFMSFVFFFCH